MSNKVFLKMTTFFFENVYTGNTPEIVDANEIRES